MKRIPVKGVFGEDDLVRLLKKLHEHMSLKKDERVSYSLALHSGDEQSLSYDEIPEDLGLIFLDKITRLRLSYVNYERQQWITFELKEASRNYSEITIQSTDQRWVNHAVEELRVALARVPQGPQFWRSYPWALIPALSVTIGYIFLRFIAWISRSVNPAPPANPAPIWLVVLAGLVMGLVPAVMTYVFVLEFLFPEVELKTGPAKSWHFATRRKIATGLFSALLLAPVLMLVREVIAHFFAG